MAYNNPLFGEIPTPNRFTNPLQPPPHHTPYPGDRISLRALTAAERIQNAQRIPAPWFFPYHNLSVTNNTRTDPLFMYPSTNPLKFQITHRDSAYKQWQKSNGLTPQAAARAAHRVRGLGNGQFLDHKVVARIPGMQDPADVQRDMFWRPRNEMRNLADELQYRICWSLVLGLIAMVGYAVYGLIGVGCMAVVFCLLMIEY
jgi:hypothetical protein